MGAFLGGGGWLGDRNPRVAVRLAGVDHRPILVLPPRAVGAVACGDRVALHRKGGGLHTTAHRGSARGLAIGPEARTGHGSYALAHA